MFTLDQIEALVRIAELGSFHAAAEALHKSQPAVSASIRKLEEICEVQLFDRSEYRPVLTEAGQMVYRCASEILSRKENLLSKVKELSGRHEPIFRLSVDPLSPVSIISRILQTLENTSITTEVEMSEGVFEENFKRVLNQEVDLALGSLAMAESASQIERIPIGHAILAAVRHIHLNRSESTPQIRVGRGRIQENARVWSVPHHERKQELILAGLGWGYVSLVFLGQHSGTLTPLNDPDLPDIHLPVFAMKLKKRDLGICGQRVWEELTRISV